MEPRIQYAKTTDGVSIAFWTVGEGPPFVWPPGAPATSGLRAWQTPEGRHFFERVAGNRRLVRYDNRGFGDSQRDISGQSLETHVADLESVVDHLGLDTFALCAYFYSAPFAIAYTVRHPERVSRLIVLNGAARGAEYYNIERFETVRKPADRDFEFFLNFLAHEAFSWEGAEQSRSWVTSVLGNIPPESVLDNIDLQVQTDVTELLAEVTVPSLIIHRRHLRFPRLDEARDLAARIPDARLSILEGDTAVPYLGDSDSVLNTIDEFLGGGEQAPRELPGGTSIILFLDIADSTALTTKLGDAAYREKERELDGSLRSAITDAGGTPVEGKVLGDGVMAVFTSARQAIDAAQRCRDLGNEAGLPLHLGMHAGDVVREGNNVHGGAVQVASRVQGVAAPGEILVSDIVRGLARTSADVQFEDRGEHELKGIPEPVRLYEVRWREEARI